MAEAWMTFTKVFKKNLMAYNRRSEGKRRALNEGGSTSSKTFSILQLLILIALNAKKFTRISVLGESIPVLKRGCIDDFKRIMGDKWEDTRFNNTDFIYSFDNAMIEFIPADMPGKLRGPRRQILYCYEANNIAWESFQQADMRTETFVFLDWNPVSEFWAHEYLLNKPENVYIHSTYKDAIDVAPKEFVEKIESLKENDPDGWKVYGLGLLTDIKGLVYPKFEIIESPDPNREISQEELDEIFRRGKIVYGLDFGFSGDPAALTRNSIGDGFIYSQELIYEKGLTNRDLSKRFEELGMMKGGAPIYADSSEPKSVEELRRDGWNIIPVEKKPGSVEFGHQRVRQFKHYWTKDSVNCIKEQRNFRYLTDKDGKPTEKTNHAYSHGMDSVRYATQGFKNIAPNRYREF